MSTAADSFTRLNTLRVTSRPVHHKATGTPFDCTVPSTALVRAAPAKATGSSGAALDEVNAFNGAKSTCRADPRAFLRGHSGTGGDVTGRTAARVRERSQSARGTRSARPSSFGPKATHARENPPNTLFRLYYERGDLPVKIIHGTVHNRVGWKVPIMALDFHHYLPMFFDGLREEEMPYAFLAEQGVLDMMRTGPAKILDVVPQLIIPLKTALNTRIHSVVRKVLKILQELVQCDQAPHGEGQIGLALVPYYRQLLPVMNLFIRQNRNIGDAIDFDKQESLGDLCEATLEVFERFGGEDAFINIKYLVPTYQSAILV